MALAFAYSALPCAVLPLIATKPVMPSTFFAATQAFTQACALLPAYRFLDEADAAFETTLPVLFLTSCVFVRPPLVFSLLPRNTTSFLSLPLAILLTFMAFFFMATFPFIGTFMAIFMATVFRKRHASVT